MSESNRLNGSTEWIDLEFMERERTSHEFIETGIQLYLAGLSLSNIKQYPEKLGVERSRTAIHKWTQKPIYSQLTMLQPWSSMIVCWFTCNIAATTPDEDY